MSRIGASVLGFQQLLLQQLASTNHEIARSSFRLATGERYSRPSDNPSAFLQVSNYRRDLSLIQGVRSNVETATTIGAGLQLAVDQARTQLEAIQAALLEDEDGALTAPQRSSRQSTIDTAISELRNLARTSISGKRWLDGSIDFTRQGLNSSQLRGVEVFSLAEDTTVSGTVTSAATQTTRRYTGASGQINSGNATWTLTGQRGATTISVLNNEALTTVRDRINQDSHLTGIVASVSGDQLDFTTVDYGADATISFTVNSGTFSTSTVTTGADAVVTLNGQAVAAERIAGNRVTVLEDGTHFVLDLNPGFTGALTALSLSSEQVARFSLSQQTSRQETLALPGLFPELLGGVSGRLSDLASGGSLAGLGSQTSAALRVIGEALDQLDVFAGRVDAFAETTVASAANLYEDLETNVSDALETLNTVDEETEETWRSHQQSLSANAIAAMAILREQHSSVLDILRNMAGLS